MIGEMIAITRIILSLIIIVITIQAEKGKGRKIKKGFHLEKKIDLNMIKKEKANRGRGRGIEKIRGCRKEKDILTQDLNQDDV